MKSKEIGIVHLKQNLEIQGRRCQSGIRVFVGNAVGTGDEEVKKRGEKERVGHFIANSFGQAYHRAFPGF